MKTSIVVTTNGGVGEWGEVLCDTTVAAAAPDAERVDHKRVARVMRTMRIAAHRWVKITVADTDAAQKVPDLLARDFTAAVPNLLAEGPASVRTRGAPRSASRHNAS